jgi:hypothetical protein
LAAFNEEAKSWQYFSLPKNISRQYIVLQTLPRPLDVISLIQGLLGSSRTFVVTPPRPHKSFKSWLGQIQLTWQEFESITSPTFGFLKLLLYPS